MIVPDGRQLILAARTKLNEYIDALWIGRADAADPLVSIYLERLAVAARLSTLLGPWSATETVKELVRQENRAFPRGFLSTDSGRAARAAFNLFARDVSALEDYKASHPSLPAFQSVIDKPLSMVAFVWDYVQLGFNGCGFNVMCPINICTQSDSIRSGDAGFRDRLCGLIGQTVRSIDVSDALIDIRFDRHRVELLLTLANDAVSGEAFFFFDAVGR